MTMIPIPLLLLPLRLLFLYPPSQAAFSPDHSFQQAYQTARIKRVQLHFQNDSLLKHDHRRNNVLSVYFSPALLQLAMTDDHHDDDSSILLSQPEQDDEQPLQQEPKSRIRRVLTFPLRLLKRPIRYLRRKIGKGEAGDSSDAQRDEIGAAAADAELTPATAPATSEFRQDTTLDTKSLVAVEEPKTMAKDMQKSAKKTSSPIVAAIDPRSPTCAKSVDLSGHWDLLVTDEFKNQYDEYLTLLGQPYLVRSVAMSIVGLTTEETRQTDSGRSLFILGRNLRGVWERNLLTEDAATRKYNEQQPFVPLQTEIITADGENVLAEAWWEDQGTTHRSWLRGVKKYGGGDFESKRFLEKKDRNNDVLVCESTFHPKDPKREKAKVTWRFTRQQQGDGGKS
jgi:hypothetical protein